MFRKSILAGGAAIGVATVVGAALPVMAQSTTGVGATAPRLYFDLGIDATQLPQNPADARAYFAKQAPETQRVLLASCRNYTSHPADAAMPETIVFCTAIIGGLG